MVCVAVFFSILYICRMTEDEKKFMAWWEINRDKQKKLVRQWFIGLPIGLIFVIPIIINLSSGWYKRADMEVNSRLNPAVLLIADDPSAICRATTDPAWHKRVQ